MPTARAVFWAATFGAFALVVRTFWLGPVPLGIALLATVLYLTLLVLGVVLPRWEMFADVIDSADAGRGLVAITFDDGPDVECTKLTLEILERHRAKATFFVIGRKAEQNPELIRAIVDAGHELGLHGYCHSRVTAFRNEQFVKADLIRARQTLQPYVNGPLRWFRPPIGHVTMRIGRVAKELGLEIVCWSVRGLDGLPGVSPSQVARRVCLGLSDGGIVALHEAYERIPGIPAGVAALDQILTGIAAEGWRSVTLTELLEGSEK
jgi:peptidoglycan-N-acetylglucosamine deacetylase